MRYELPMFQLNGLGVNQLSRGGPKFIATSRLSGACRYSFSNNAKECAYVYDVTPGVAFIVLAPPFLWQKQQKLIYRVHCRPPYWISQYIEYQLKV